MQDGGGSLRGGIDDATRQAWNRCGDFTLSLIKTLLQTGTYSADHPLAQQASADLYNLFRVLTQDAPELSYVLMSAVDDRGVIVEGLLPEPIEIAKTFRNLMGDHFVAKFHDYFLRNRIASFTIKREIDRAEFQRFLEIWVGWGQRLGGDITGPDSANRLFQELSRHDVVHVTIVGIDEVLGAFRQLLWPVKIALSRLRKDLVRLPLLKGHESPQALAALKVHAVTDVMRPITRHELLRDIVLNLDLVADGLAETSLPELEATVLEALPPATLHGVSLLLLDLLAEFQAKPGQTRVVGRDPKELVEVARHALRSALMRLAALDVPESRPVLEQCHLMNLIAHDDLPKAVQRRLRAGRSTTRFIEHVDAYLADLDSTPDPVTYRKYMDAMALVLPELVARRQVELVGRVFEQIARHRTGPSTFPGRDALVSGLLGNLETGGFIDELLRLSLATPKEVRDAMERAVALFGHSVVPGLVMLLATNEDASARKAACSTLVRVGEPALRYILDELRARRHSWFTVRNLVQVLADIGNAEAVPVLVEQGAHPNPKVREECVAALARLAGDDAEALLLPFLDDGEEAVARRAILHLSQLRSTASPFLRRMHDAIRVRSRDEEEPSEAFQAACMRALMEYEKVLMPSTPDFEATLVEIVAPPRFKTMLPGRLGIRPKPDGLVLLAIEALGFRGGGHTAQALTALAIGQDADKARAAQLALEALKRRQDGNPY